jgi:hypothetical protein
MEHTFGSTSTGRGQLVARKLVAATWTHDNWTHATIGRDENWTRENNNNNVLRQNCRTDGWRWDSKDNNNLLCYYILLLVNKRNEIK